MASVVLFILRSIMLLYSTGSHVNRVQVVLSEYSVTLLKTLCMYGLLYILAALVLVDVMVMLSVESLCEHARV